MVKNQQCKRCMHCIISPRQPKYPEDDHFVFRNKRLNYICAIHSDNEEMDDYLVNIKKFKFIDNVDRVACDDFTTTELEREKLLTDKIENKGW